MTERKNRKQLRLTEPNAKEADALLLRWCARHNQRVNFVEFGNAVFKLGLNLHKQKEQTRLRRVKK